MIGELKSYILRMAIIVCGLLAADLSFGFTVTTSVTSSSCLNNGSFTAKTTGADASGAGIEFTLIPLDRTQPSQGPFQNALDPSTYTFTGLDSGEYVIEVVDNTGTVVTDTNVVTTTYVQPEIVAIDIIGLQCPGGSDAEASAVLNVGASATPFTFYLLDSDGNFLDTSTTNTFTGIPEGTFTIRVVDACGIIYNRGFTIQDNYGTFRIISDHKPRRDCATTRIRVRTRENLYPLTTEVILSDGTIFSTNVINSGTLDTEQSIIMPNVNGVRYRITDRCGRSVSRTHNLQNPPRLPYEIAAAGCGYEVDLSLGGEHAIPSCTRVSYCISPTGLNTWTCYEDAVIPLPSTGAYDFKLIDSCCATEWYTRPAISVPSPYIRQRFTNISCLDGANTCFIRLMNFADNATLIFRGYNAISQELSPFTTTPDNDSRLLQPTIQVGDTLPFENTDIQYLSVGNMIPGTYYFNASDMCGNSRNFQVVMNASDGIYYDISVEAIPGCIGEQSIDLGIDGRMHMFGSGNIFLTDSMNTRVFSGRVNTGSGHTINVPNLAPSRYTARFELPGKTRRRFYDCPDVLREAVIENYERVSLTSALRYDCGAEATLATAASEGRAPYTYFYREDGTSTWSAPQSNPLFTGLDNTLEYEVQVEDVCGQNSILRAGSGTLLPPIISAAYDCSSLGGNASEVILNASPVLGGTYTWTDNAGNVLASSQNVTINPLVVGETYVINTEIPGSTGSCATAMDSIRIHTSSCSVLEITLSDFSVKRLNGEMVGIEWIVTSQTDNAYYELERSGDAASWQSIHTVPGDGTTSETKYYKHIDDAPLPEWSYYRLKIVSLSGEIEYGPIKSIYSDGMYQVDLGPNPVSAGNPISVFLAEPSGSWSYKLISQLSIEMQNGTVDAFQIPTTGLSPGLYILQILDANGRERMLRRVIITD